MSQPEIIIQPIKRWTFIDVQELSRYRELFFIFAWRDIKVRYKQTALGIIWVVFQPIVTTLIFTVFFGKLASIQSHALPYPLFVLSGLVMWNFFSHSLSQASDSMVTNDSIIKKVYFPKIILPLSSIMTNYIDLAINTLCLLVYAVFLGFYPNISFIVIFPVATILATVAVAGIGMFLSAFNVKYRDVRYILPFFIQLLLFLTPIIYPTTILSETNKNILALNPMTLPIELIRYTFTQHFTLTFTMVCISLASIFAMVGIGITYFNKTEQFFADTV